MKQIRKIAALAVAVIMLFTLASCSMVNANETDITTDNIKIGVILKETRDSKTGSSGICNAAIDSVVELKFGISEERFKVIENVDPSDADAVAEAYKSLINFECNIIIASDPDYMDDTAKVADSTPNTAFLVYGAEKGNGKNLFAFDASIEEAVYLEGIAAGLKAAELKMPNLGFVLADAKDYTAVNAFAAGAASVNPAVKVSAAAAENDNAAIAKKLITSGCAVIASDIQSEDIAKTAVENDAFFCDFGTQAFIGAEEEAPDFDKAVLCAPLYDFTQYLVDTIKAVVDYPAPESADKGIVELLIADGKLKDYAGSYKLGSVYLSEVSLANAAKGTTEAISAASAKLLDGSLKLAADGAKPAANVTIAK